MEFGTVCSARRPIREPKWNYAIQLQSKYPKNGLAELTAQTAPKEWSLESRELAIKYGYLKGELKGSTNADSALRVTGRLHKEAKIVAEQQASVGRLPFGG